MLHFKEAGNNCVTDAQLESTQPSFVAPSRWELAQRDVVMYNEGTRRATASMLCHLCSVNNQAWHERLRFGLMSNVKACKERRQGSVGNQQNRTISPTFVHHWIYAYRSRFCHWWCVTIRDADRRGLKARPEDWFAKLLRTAYL